MKIMQQTHLVSPSEAAQRLGDIVQDFMSELRRRFPAVECVMEAPGYGDEDVVIRVYGKADELNVLSNAAAQLSAEFDTKYGVFILALVSPMSNCPVKLC